MPSDMLQWDPMGEFMPPKTRRNRNIHQMMTTYENGRRKYSDREVMKKYDISRGRLYQIKVKVEKQLGANLKREEVYNYC